MLGELYSRCDSITDSIPVYLAGEEPTLLGHVDQSLGHFADAFSFFIDEVSCKKLCSGQYDYKFDYNKATGRSLRLNSITLVGRAAAKIKTDRANS